MYMQPASLPTKHGIVLRPLLHLGIDKADTYAVLCPKFSLTYDSQQVIVGRVHQDDVACILNVNFDHLCIPAQLLQGT